MKCKNCGNQVMDDWSRCPFCGTTIEKKRVCSGCGNELQPDWSMCPICGQKVGGEADSKSLPSLESVLPFDDGLDLVADDIAEAKQRIKEAEKAEYDKKLTLARVACIRKNYQQAQTIYEGLLADNAEDANAYIGFVRIASQNYTVLESSEVAEAIRIAKQVLGVDNLSKFDKDFANYEAKRKAHFDAIAEEKRQAKLAAERAAKAEAERKAKEEAERKAKEEAERKAKAEKERKAKLEAERKAKEEAERRAREEAERKVKEEEARKRKEEEDRLAKIEAERKAKEEAERKRKEAEARKKRAEAAKKKKEEEEKIAAEKKREEKYRSIISNYNKVYGYAKNGDVEHQYDTLGSVIKLCGEVGDYKDAKCYRDRAISEQVIIQDKVKKIREKRKLAEKKAEKKRFRKKVFASRRARNFLYFVEALLALLDFWLLTKAHQYNWWFAVAIIALDVVVHIILRKTIVEKQKPSTQGPYLMTFLLFFVYVIVAVCAMPPVGNTGVMFDHSQSGGINVLWNVLITIAEIIVLGVSKIGSVALGLDI